MSKSLGIGATMKQLLKKVMNKFSAVLFFGSVMVGLLAGLPSQAEAHSSWYVSFSTGPVWVAPPCHPPRVVRCRPVYYCYPCPPPVVYYPAPVVTVSYHKYRR
ncbi:MAG: hypothetical protein N2Z21_08360 [Candidatus Sumerlaeaceae bacterium]|nr:hypothetical protein [Candidatus Sumerlaeaceae bacterium]